MSTLLLEIINYSTDNAPILSGIQNQTIFVGGSFATFDLDDFVSELDGDSVTFQISSSDTLDIQIDSNNVVTIVPSDLAWIGSDTVRFTVIDITSSGHSTFQDVVFTVKINSPIQLSVDSVIDLGLNT